MERLIDSLKRCADAHGAKHEYCGRETQFIFYKCNVPTLADAKAIVRGFCGDTRSMDWSNSMQYITIFLDECHILPDSEIDWDSINMALPCEIADEITN